MQPVLSLRNVSKRFRRVQALDGVSFDVLPGTVFALLGANGAGKSTAIRTLLGLERPDSGTADVLGMNPRVHSQEIRRRVGYVAEKPALYEWMTVEEIGWFAAGFYPPGYQAEYERHVQRFALDGRQKISELSKGTRAKVSLALALAHNPELLILDEPTSGLDPLVRREFLESMVDVASAGRTVLLCSHQVHEVERVADIVAILLNGKLVCVERLEDLKRDARELIVTLPDLKTPLPALPGKLLAHVRFGHEHVVIVRELDEERLATALQGIGPCEVRHPSLEEILLAILRERRSVAAGKAHHEVAQARSVEG